MLISNVPLKGVADINAVLMGKQGGFPCSSDDTII